MPRTASVHREEAACDTGLISRQREPPRRRGNQGRTSCARSRDLFRSRRNGDRSGAVPGPSGLLFRRNWYRSAWYGVPPRGPGSGHTELAVPALPPRHAPGRPGRPTAARESRNDRVLSRRRTRNARKVPAGSYSYRQPPSARRGTVRNQITPWYAHYLLARQFLSAWQRHRRNYKGATVR